MASEPPADSGGTKPGANNNNTHARRHHQNKGHGRENRKTFTGAEPKLGVFELGADGLIDQRAEFKATDEKIIIQIGKLYDPLARQSILKGELVEEEPPTLKDNPTKADEIMYSKLLDRFLLKKEKIASDLCKAFNLYLGQVGPQLLSTLQELDGYEDMINTCDVITLRQLLITNTITVTSKKIEPFMKMFNAVRDSVNLIQRKTESDQEYYHRFVQSIKVIEGACGSDVLHTCNGATNIICQEHGTKLEDISAEDKEQALEMGKDRLQAMHFLLNADRSRYGHLVDAFCRDYLSNTNNFPKTLKGAYSLLINTVPKRKDKGRKDDVASDNAGLSFNTVGEGNNRKEVCERCGWNHPTDMCSAKKHRDGTVLHILGSTSGDSVRDDVDVSAGSRKGVVFYCGDELEQLMFLQSDSRSTATPTSCFKGGIPDSWMLIDNQSTIDVFSNRKLLSNIYRCNIPLTIRCNAGVRTTYWRGFLSGYGWVWYFPEGIANILLSLSRVKEKFRVTFDSAVDNCFHVHKDDGTILKFHEASRRLYYFDTANRTEVAGTLLITTVEDNIKQLSGRDYTQAKLARSIQHRIGRPSTRDFIRYVSMNLIPNCPVSVQDIKNAEFIWGPDLGSLQGKTVRQQPRAIRITPSNIPSHIHEQYKDVTLSVDIMKVTGIPFLMTISRHIKFGTAGKLNSMRNGHIIAHFKTIIGTYVTRGFRVTLMLADNQFESMRGDLADLHVQLEIVARDEHVHEAERFNRTIKERVRALFNVLPYQHIPPIFVIEMVYHAVYWRNMFALKGGISTTQSPSQIVLNRSVDFNANVQLEFGEYVQTHEEHDNSMTARTVGALATRPSNSNGAYYFISLNTGRRINRNHWTRLPMPNEVISQVHRMARRANAPRHLTFSNNDGVDLDELYTDLARDEDDLSLEDAADAGVTNDEVGDDSNDDDSDYNDNDDESSEDHTTDDGSSEDEGEIPGVDDDDEEEDAGEIPGVEDDEEEENYDEIPELNEDEEEEEEEDDDNDDEDDDDEIPGVDNDQADDSSITEVDDEAERTYSHMNLRSQSRKNYDVFTMFGTDTHDDEIVLLNFSDQTEDGFEETEMDQIEAEYLFLTETLGWGEGMQEIESITTKHDPLRITKLAEYLFLTEQTDPTTAEHLFVTEQMNWRRGLKEFGEKGEDAIEKELQQIHDMHGFQPKHWYELTEEERANALRYLMYLKEKRDGKIKGRGCADGRPQRLYTTKTESSSPTVSLGAIMLTCMIDAFEGRDVATLDIPGAFLQTEMPDGEKDVHVMLDGRMAELLAKISPETYQEYVHHRRGQAYIYCKLNVALYGTLKAALLFWKKLSTSLKARGFTVNPYDWCVMNKMINGKQFTIVWHVDDLKLSHMEPAVVDDIIASLKEEYGKVGELTVRRGKVHDYLGMKLDFSEKGSFTVDMEEYLDGMLEEAPEDMNGTATTPAADHLFKTRDSAPKLDTETAALFHRLTAQMLFVCQRGRPDLRTTVSFLTKRVQAPDEDDYKKLARAIKYIRRTKFLRLNIAATHLDQNHWFIDGAFAVHDNMRSHTGAYMTFGKGMLDGSSSGQKINTTSSTEAETVAVHENMPAILWTRYFLEEQGYPLKPSVVHQDNQTAMLLETNGRGSSSKRTRHMNIRYFFVADVLQRKEIILAYCPTDEMIGDFFTKPLGGAKFRRFRNIIMNISHDEYGPVDVDELTALHNAKMQKRIEFDANMNRIESNDMDRQMPSDSQECVGDKTQRGHDRKPTYAEIARRTPTRQTT